MKKIEDTKGEVLFTANDLVASYSRQDALDDGVLVDVTDQAAACHIRYPVALTETVWHRYVENDAPGESVAERIGAVLQAFTAAARRGAGNGQEMLFTLHVSMRDRGDWLESEGVPTPARGFTRETHRLVQLKGHCGPGDKGEPVITIMLPNED
ncbi:hypothetical protein H8A99_42045 [Bradyrhizobium sp. Arg68]|uniref:DUF6573 family protein n=1 Tax=Bradyrhizobium ivorense TaxID=2511166 RepID=UPI001E34FEA7|nr:DUF6573 family protein [Bradyrhizobium ivorense]MCC8942821.1 hypothetical protein [Bradyrhizobium ivorense]